MIPQPARVEWLGGELPSRLLEEVICDVPDADVQALAAVIREALADQAGGPGRLPVRVERASTPAPEGYSLRIDGGGARMRGSIEGLRHAWASLGQLLDAGDTLPHVLISDAPAFPHRGVMLDVSRHFMPTPDVLAFIAELARLKFNVFHWHLTDDQGWRIELPRFPALTGVGAWRPGTLIGHADAPGPPAYEARPHGGFYTQSEIREVVAFAAGLGITVIPEIDLPGHSSAALAAYPQYSCHCRPGDVWQGWGVRDHVFCTRDESLDFLEQVLDEVLPLFPSPLIHLGGDEVPTTHWEDCPDCQAVMAREGLQDVEELHRYVMARLARFLQSRGRRLAAWDEITDTPPVPAGTLVLSWRGTEGGVLAARAGFETVMCPASHVYLDHYQADPAGEPLAIGGLSTLETVYSFRPVPPELEPRHRGRVLGGQANLWREYMPDTAHVQYMAFPRLHALAEVLWSPQEGLDFADFHARLGRQLPALTRRGVRFRPLDRPG
ncbi:beta-N-acetylhexosaminidase [Deinococcus koreensis]|uniref:beta-N-acetylhexosaminidase n=1 Tax=Deinococcus koreensis TaxID=2054903 RepID=UPI0013FE1245|nr:beta-N-acetylhexosaminidase [Deinococcus koreensis]